MKKKFILFLTVFFLSTNNSFSTTGNGEVTLSNNVINGYIDYLMMNSIGTDAKNRPAEYKKGNPDFFAITKSGNHYGFSYCPRGQSCRFDPTLALQICKKYSNTERCYIFDRKRKIVWNNKNFKISRKATSSEIREILEELGFTGTKKSSTTNSSATETKPKITKKKKVEDDDIVKQLKELNSLLESGVISAEEFA